MAINCLVLVLVLHLDTKSSESDFNHSAGSDTLSPQSLKSTAATYQVAFIGQGFDSALGAWPKEHDIQSACLDT